VVLQRLNESRTGYRLHGQITGNTERPAEMVGRGNKEKRVVSDDTPSIPQVLVGI